MQKFLITRQTDRRKGKRQKKTPTIQTVLITRQTDRKIKVRYNTKGAKRDRQTYKPTSF